MSYTRSFTKTITSVHRGYVSYPKSESGGTISYESTVQELIEFEVTVDTEPFEDSIDDMKDEVDILTGTVAATEAAQVASIRENSHKIGQTIISGFFKTVRSDISQQIAQLKIKCDALLMQMHELAKRCKDKQRAMSVDYQRITSRYAKIFEELDRELDNRIHSIDEPVFRFVDKTSQFDEEISRMVAIPTVNAAENMRAHSKITAAHAKQQAAATLGKIKRFLNVQYSTDRLLDKCLLKGNNEEATYSAPFCVIEGSTENGATSSQVYSSPIIDGLDKNKLLQSVDTENDNTGELLATQEVQSYFNSEVAAMVSENPSSHNERVARLASQMMQSAIKK